MTWNPRRQGALSAALAAASLLLPLAAAATSGWANVSERVLGVAEPNPVSPGPATPCGSACRYVSVSGTRMVGSYAVWPGELSEAAWPLAFTSVQPSVAPVSHALPSPHATAGLTLDTLGPAALRRSRVAYSPLWNDPPESRALEVQTWKSGSGGNALSWAVRIQTPAGAPRRTYLEFAVPTLDRPVKLAGGVGGPSGDEPFTLQPERLQARAAMDVYVDGVPVWSAESLRLLPRRYRPDLRAPFELSIDGTLDGGRVTLFLGSLPGGSVRTATVVMRNDLRVDAPTCHDTHSAYSGTLRRCHAQIERLRVPTQALAPFYIHAPDISVYTR